MEPVKKFWPLFVLLGIGVVALALMGLDSGKDGKGAGGKEWQGDDVHTLDSGLKYIDEQEGDGEEAKTGDSVSVLYTGRLADSKEVFDSTSKRNDEPLTFTIGAPGIIRGWHEGVAGMKVGGKRKLYIPAKLGYGAQGRAPAIPPNADLEFDIELVKIGQ